MDRVHTAAQRPLEEVRRAAVAIGITTPNQRHIGVLHREGRSGQVLMLHLEWHHILTNGDPNPEFLWVDPAVLPQRLVQLAAVCRRVWRANKSGGIPYGFSPPTDAFDEETGRHLFGPTRTGLTCATFVLAVFQRAGLQLVRYESWPVGRPGDAEWQARIVDALQRTGAIQEHVQAVRSEIGSVRFRPEEVAGAAAFSNLPADFHPVSELGEAILARVTPQSSS
jgi:hypothetical protein